jgi:HSP20 family protein
MRLIKYRPPAEVDPLSWLSGFRDDLDQFFERKLAPWQASEGDLLEGAWTPLVDVCEDKDSILVRADLPGLKKEEIDLSILGRTLTIKGEKKSETEVEEENYQRVERSYGLFQRTVELPAEVDEAKVEAAYKDGVLEVKLPKQEKVKGKKIAIKAGEKPGKKGKGGEKK